MKTLFLASGPIDWASARLRCYWPAAYMGADVIGFDRRGSINGADYDAFIFQKVFDIEDARKLKEAGKRVYWDLCDPVHWFKPEDARAILATVDGVVCSSEALRQDVATWCKHSVPTHTIPDRLELSAYPMGHKHSDIDPVRLIWYGIAANRIALYGALTNLARLASNGYGIELTIFDESPQEPFCSAEFPLYYSHWTLQLESPVISSHDLAILPPYPGPWGAVKSNNKHLTAWACGLPVASGLDYEELRWLVEDYEERQTRADQGAELLEAEYDVRQSAADWEAILCKS